MAKVLCELVVQVRRHFRNRIHHQGHVAQDPLAALILRREGQG